MQTATTSFIQALAVLVSMTFALETDELATPYTKPQVTCYLNFPYLHLTVSIHRNDVASLGEATQFHIQTRHSNETWFTWSTCMMASRNPNKVSGNSLDCKMWNLQLESKASLSQIYYLRLEYYRNNSWLFVNETAPPSWSPIRDLFSCFSSYDVKDLRIVSQTRNEIAFTYQQNPDNSFYNIVVKSQRVEVSPVNGDLRRKNTSASHSVDHNCHGLCFVTVKGLQSCLTYNLCVSTVYENRTEPFRTCIKTPTTKCSRGLTHEGIVFLVIAISIALIIVTLSLAYKKWVKLKRHRRNFRGDRLDSEELVSERDSLDEVFVPDQSYDPVKTLDFDPEPSTDLQDKGGVDSKY